MSKRSRKSKQKIAKPNLPRSKDNPSGKGNDPDIYWPKYAGGRKSEGRNYIEWMGNVADFIRKPLGLPKSERDRRISAVPAAVLKSEGEPPRWGPARHFAKHPGDLERCEIDRPYGKSRCRLRVWQTDSAVLHRIIGRVAGDAAARGTKIVDSAGFRHIQVYRDWHNAEYGTISVKQFAKPRVARALYGVTCAAAVTPCRTNDPPYLMDVLAKMPRGSGDVLADAQYCGAENCRAVQGSGRRRIIEPRSDYKIEGEDAGAEMLRFPGERSGAFRKLLRKRNNVESVFSPVKERFGGVARAVKSKTQIVELLSMCAYHNMTFA